VAPIETGDRPLSPDAERASDVAPSRFASEN